MALLGIPSGAVVRAGARTTMLVCDFARAPLMASIPILYALDLLSFPRCCSRSCSPSASSWRRTSRRSGRFSRSSSARTSGDVAGEQPDRGRSAFAALGGPALAGVLIPFIGAPSVLSSTPRRSSSRSRSSSAARAANGSRCADADRRGVLAGLRSCTRPPARAARPTIVAGRLPRLGLSAALPVLAYDAFASSRVAGLFYAPRRRALIGSDLRRDHRRKSAAASAREVRGPRVRGAALDAAHDRASWLVSSSRSSWRRYSRRSSTARSSR